MWNPLRIPKIVNISCIKSGGGRQSVNNRQKYIKISWKLTKTWEKTKKYSEKLLKLLQFPYRLCYITKWHPVSTCLKSGY